MPPSWLAPTTALVVGLGEGENFAASDTSALLQVTRNIVYLEEGDCAEVSLDEVKIVEKARGRDYGLRSLVHEVVQSPLFRNK